MGSCPRGVVWAQEPIVVPGMGAKGWETETSSGPRGGNQRPVVGLRGRSGTTG